MVTEQPDRAFPNPPRAVAAAADSSFASFLEYTLEHMGLSVEIENKPSALLDRLRDQPADLLILESSLPDVDVRSLCARIRLDKRTRGMAVLVLAAKHDEQVEKEMLDSGADEYLSRPFSPEKLTASIRALLKERTRSLEPGAPDLLTFLDVELDLVNYRVRRGGRVIHLAPTEFRLLCHLMKNPRKVYSRNELQHAAWPRVVSLGPRTVDVHIGRLRAALNETGELDLIRTVRSVGYALSD